MVSPKLTVDIILKALYTDNIRNGDKAMISQRTNKEITMGYYFELTGKYNTKTITEDERFDLELCLAAYETNSWFR